QTFYTGKFCYAVALGDADADGSLDAFTADRYSYTVSCLLNQGDGTLEEAPVFPAGYYSSDIAAGDLDGDGDTDLAVADLYGNYAYVLRNQGGGAFTTQAVPPGGLETGAYGALALGDVDGDGDTDIVLTPYDPGGYVATLLNDGSGNFNQVVTSTITYQGDLYSTSAALGDVNGDGDLDLVWSSYYGYVLVGLGDGSGAFADPARYAANGYDTRKVALGDVDGDGDTDIVAASYYADTDGYGVAVLLNTGAGFDPAQNFYSGYYNTALALGDLDGDGDLDVAVTGDLDSYTSLLYTLLGDGTGAFTPFAAQIIGAGAADLKLGDFDGDGNLDALSANHYFILSENDERNSQNSSVLLGGGDGTFGLPLGFGWGDDPVAVATGDLNGDGLLDFAGVSRYRYQYYRPVDNDVYVFFQR
ncbi:MAG TPA: VCBS repeat-containing protein, partial [Candidatus Nitrosotenuis sp.]|nr:VCBS repeat-containing protein [Candidatus Nitrosotenuis sp.]